MVQNSNKWICGRARLREAETTWNSFLILVWHRKNAVCFLYAQGELEESNPRRLSIRTQQCPTWTRWARMIQQPGGRTKVQFGTWWMTQQHLSPFPWPLKLSRPLSPWNLDAILGEDRAGWGEGVRVCVTRTTLNWLGFPSSRPSRKRLKIQIKFSYRKISFNFLHALVCALKFIIFFFL